MALVLPEFQCSANEEDAPPPPPPLPLHALTHGWPSLIVPNLMDRRNSAAAEKCILSVSLQFSLTSLSLSKFPSLNSFQGERLHGNYETDQMRRRIKFNTSAGKTLVKKVLKRYNKLMSGIRRLKRLPIITSSKCHSIMMIMIRLRISWWWWCLFNQCWWSPPINPFLFEFLFCSSSHLSDQTEPIYEYPLLNFFPT